MDAVHALFAGERARPEQLGVWVSTLLKCLSREPLAPALHQGREPLVVSALVAASLPWLDGTTLGKTLLGGIGTALERRGLALSQDDQRVMVEQARQLAKCPERDRVLAALRQR